MSKPRLTTKLVGKCRFSSNGKPAYISTNSKREYMTVDKFISLIENAEKN